MRLSSPLAVLSSALDSSSNDSFVRRSKVGDRVLLFLESLQDPKFEIPPGRPVPEGFTEQNYYGVILSARYGKLVLSGDK